MSLYALVGALETGLAFALVALGSYITFRVLDFPDLTVEGSFPLGAAVAAKLMVSGVDPWTATFAAMGAGCLAGFATAFLNIRLRIMHILASILTAIALYSINLRIMGRPNIGLINMRTVYTFWEQLGIPSLYVPIVVLAIAVVVCKILVDLFLSTGVGLAMRAAGANPRMAQANGVHVNLMIVVGLGIANALTGLSGALFAQMLGAADVSMGIGVIVVALASVIGGTALMPSRHHSAADARLRPRIDRLSAGDRTGSEFRRHRHDRVGRKRRDGRLGGDSLIFTWTTVLVLDARHPSRQMIRIENIEITFNKGTALENRALRGINLSIPQGQFLTVIGSNGAGKTTLLNILAGELKPDGGRVIVDDTDITFWPVHGARPRSPACFRIRGPASANICRLSRTWRSPRHGHRRGVSGSR